MKISNATVQALKTEMACLHSLIVTNQKTLNELKSELLKEKSNQARKAGVTILTSLILAILFISLIGIILLPLCLTGHLSSLALALGTQQVTVLALVACSIVFLVCLAAVICLFINGNENKISIK